MQNKVASLSATPDPTIAPPSATTVPDNGAQMSKTTDVGSDQADLRLVIEEKGGSYVYMTVDRRTGDVVAQYPREEVLKLREEAAYEAGDVIKTRA